MADTTTIQLTGLDGVYDMLRSLPAEVVSKRGGPVKTALRKGAVIIRKAEIANLRVVTSNQTKEESISTGLLAKNVIVSRGKRRPMGMVSAISSGFAVRPMRA